ncbi:hypothetical protein ACFV0D_34870, partial [Streptomyces sp. NPDC059556]
GATRPGPGTPRPPPARGGAWGAAPPRARLVARRFRRANRRRVERYERYERYAQALRSGTSGRAARIPEDPPS